MWFSRLTKRWSPIAVDFGATSMRALQLRAGRGGPIVHETACVEDGASFSEGESPSVSDRAAQLSRLLEHRNFRGRAVAAVLDPPWMDLHPTRLPATLLEGERRDVIEALRWEVGRVLTIPKERAEFDYWPLPLPVSGSSSSANHPAMAVSADRQVLTQLTDACRTHRLTCTRIDVGPCVLVAACVSRVRPAERDIWGILDLGAESNKLTVAVHRTPVYQRIVPASGRELTERLATVLKVEPPIAEDLKRQWGIRPHGPSNASPSAALGQIREEDVPGLVFSILRPALKSMHREIERAFAYVMQLYPESSPKCLVLGGRGAHLHGLAGWLTEALGVPVGRLDEEWKASGDDLESNRPDDLASGNEGAWTGRSEDRLGMMRVYGLALLAFYHA